MGRVSASTARPRARARRISSIALATRQMHEVGGRAGQLGHRERAATAAASDSGGRLAAKCVTSRLAGGEQPLGAVSDQVLVLGMDREQRAAVGRDFEMRARSRAREPRSPAS